MYKALITIQYKSSVVVTHSCNLSAQEAEAEGLGAQSHSWLHKELKAAKRCNLSCCPQLGTPEDQCCIVLSGDFYNVDTPKQK